MSNEERELWETQIRLLQEIRDELRKFNEDQVFEFEPAAEDEVMCANCHEIVPDDYGRQTEHDGFICEQCLINGYGQ